MVRNTSDGARCKICIVVTVKRHLECHNVPWNACEPASRQTTAAETQERILHPSSFGYSHRRRIWRLLTAFCGVMQNNSSKPAMWQSDAVFPAEATARVKQVSAATNCAASRPLCLHTVRARVRFFTTSKNVVFCNNTTKPTR